MRGLSPAVVLVLAGCAVGAPATSDRPPIDHVVVGELREHAPHEDAETDVRPGASDPTDPVELATAAIVTGLTGQDLQVFDAGGHVIERDGSKVVVRVVATHRIDDVAGTHTSIYDVDLVSCGGNWCVAAARPVM
jgi:hypothetical protein